MNEAIYLGSPDSIGLEFMTLMTGAMITGRQAGMALRK